MTIEEINPELFLWELYDPAGPWLLDDALYVAESFGYCDASRLPVRPRSEGFALMVFWPNGVKFWFHAPDSCIELVKKRCNRPKYANVR